MLERVLYVGICVHSATGALMIGRLDLFGEISTLQRTKTFQTNVCSNFAATVWERTVYGRDGQGCTYFWPCRVLRSAEVLLCVVAYAWNLNSTCGISQSFSQASGSNLKHREVKTELDFDRIVDDGGITDYRLFHGVFTNWAREKRRNALLV